MVEDLAVPVCGGSVQKVVLASILGSWPANHKGQVPAHKSTRIATPRCRLWLAKSGHTKLGYGYKPGATNRGPTCVTGMPPLRYGQKLGHFDKGFSQKPAGRNIDYPGLLQAYRQPVFRLIEKAVGVVGTIVQAVVLDQT